VALEVSSWTSKDAVSQLTLVTLLPLSPTTTTTTTTTMSTDLVMVEHETPAQAKPVTSQKQEPKLTPTSTTQDPARTPDPIHVLADSPERKFRTKLQSVRYNASVEAMNRAAANQWMLEVKFCACLFGVVAACLLVLGGGFENNAYQSVTTLVPNEATALTCPFFGHGLVEPVIEFQVWRTQPTRMDRCTIALPPRETCNLTAREHKALIDATHPSHGGAHNLVLLYTAGRDRECIFVTDYVSVSQRIWFRVCVSLVFLLLATAFGFHVAHKPTDIDGDILRAESEWLSTLK
jgi:hypothetical protein